MEVIINHKIVHVDPNSTLVQALFVYGVSLVEGRKGTAVAVNDVVVPHHSWAETRLQPADRIVIFKAAQGG